MSNQTPPYTSADGTTPQYTRLVSCTTPPLFFDYGRQAWVKAGVYQDCGHPQEGEEYTDATGRLHVGVWEGCSCYGREHAGERAPDSASEYLRLEAASRR